MRYRTLTVSSGGPVACLSLARPGEANRIARATLDELAAACEAIAEDAEVRAVVLSAEGDDFCAGWDTDVLQGDIAALANAFDCIAALPQPVIAAVHGDVISAGLELALACDIRIASDDARFALPESQYGLLPLAGGAARLPRLVGRGAATELLLTGRSIDANEAYRIGLVNRVGPRDVATKGANAIAQQIAQVGPIAARYAKEAIAHGQDMTLDQALRYETDLTVILQTTEDRAEGVRAFIDKRPPQFKGR